MSVRDLFNNNPQAFSLPAAKGTNGQVLASLGNGLTAWGAGGGGGGGNFSTPSNQDLDMNSYRITNVSNLSLIAGSGQLNMNGSPITNLQYINGMNGIASQRDVEINMNALDSAGLTQTVVNASIVSGVELYTQFQTLNYRL